MLIQLEGECIEMVILTSTINIIISPYDEVGIKLK